MKSARIAIASRIFTPEPSAASVRLSALATALAENDYRVDVYTSRPPQGLSSVQAQLSGVRIRRAPVLRDRQGYVRGYVQYMSFDIPLFFRLLFGPRFDLCVVEPPPTTGFVVRMVCGMRRMPYAFYAADIVADALASMPSNSLVKKVVRSMEVWAWSGAKVVFSVSPEVTQRIAEFDIPSQVVTIGNGIDTDTFALDGSVHREERPYWLYAGTASEVHGAGIFIDAFKRIASQHPEIDLVFLGQGTDWPQLMSASSELGNRVRFVGRVSPEETAEWMRGSVATLASVNPGSYDIAFPTKIYASTACGTPVIFAGTGPAEAFVRKEKAGWSVGYDAQAVAQAMTESLAAPFSHGGRQKLASAVSQSYSLRSVAQRAVDQIKNLLQSKQTKQS